VTGAALGALLAAVTLAGAAEAQGPERRLLSIEEAVPFQGVGRLNVAGTRFCTATLISETVIVTAAHCLFHPRTRAEVPLAEFRFVAGLRMGESAALRRVVRKAIQPDFAFEGFASPKGVVADLALLELDEPVAPEDAAAFPTAEHREGGGPLAIVSYARDRAQAPSIETPCGVAAAFAGVLALDCAVNYGASGAPVLQGEGGDLRLVAVVSAMGTALATGEPVTLAVETGPWIEPLLAALAHEPRVE
jgi:protease YdgD